MQLLALEQEVSGITVDHFTGDLLRAEAQHVYALQQAGVIRNIYFRADRTDAVMMLECADVAEAESVLASLPLVAAGLITFELIPLRPYPGLSRLFAAQD